jgi:hypothetical protein
MELLPQSVTDNLIETDQEGDGGGRRGNPKERMPEKGHHSPHCLAIEAFHYAS